MSKITALRRGRRNDNRVNLFLDGRFAFSLDAEEALRQGLQVGQELADDRVAALVQTLHLSRCLDAAYRYLGYRPRSEAELRERLCRRGFPEEHIETTVRRLKEQDFLNDTAFAQFWRENRQAFRPRSRFLTRLELQKKGIPAEVIQQVVGAIDDGEAAYRAAQAKARRLAVSDYQEFRQRLGEYLRRRGFGYEVISSTVKRVWKERQK